MNGLLKTHTFLNYFLILLHVILLHILLQIEAQNMFSWIYWTEEKMWMLHKLHIQIVKERHHCATTQNTSFSSSERKAKQATVNKHGQRRQHMGSRHLHLDKPCICDFWVPVVLTGFGKVGALEKQRVHMKEWLFFEGFRFIEGVSDYTAQTRVTLHTNRLLCDVSVALQQFFL